MIDIYVNETSAVDIEVSDSSGIEIQIEGELIRVGDYEHYEGEYTFIPNFEQHKLQTKNKVMDSDLLVDSIPLTRVSNPSGGKTVIIGG